MEVLFARMEALEAKLGINSENSSKPASADGLAKKQKSTLLRGASGKAVGSQRGRKRSTLKRVTERDSRIIEHHRITTAAEVRCRLKKRTCAGVSPGIWCSDDVLEVEHRFYTVLCSCGQRHDSAPR